MIKFAALLEIVTGLALVLAPETVVRLLLAGERAGTGRPLSSLAGVGLLSLGVACWPAGPAARRGMLTYNVLVTLCLLRLGLQGEWAGPLLWPAVGLHAFLSLGLGRRR